MRVKLLAGGLNMPNLAKYVLAGISKDTLRGMLLARLV